MQIKLSASLEKHFAGQSPEQVVGALEALVQADIEAKAQPKNIITLDQFNALSAKVDGLTESLGAKVAEAVKPFEAKIVALDTRVTEAVTTAKADASKVVAEAIAKTGLQAPIGGQQQDGSAAKAGAEVFPALVTEKAKSMSKAKAIEVCIKENPTAYEAWRNNGCQPSL